MQTKKLLIYLFMLFVSAVSSLEMMAQNTVTGKVSDAAGDPLIGVNVVEKGSSNGTVTMSMVNLL
jgi:hypothetical protein